MRMLGWGLALLALAEAGEAQQSKKKSEPPATIKSLMETTHKGKDNLASEVRNGFGKDGDAQKLLEVYQKMAAMKPPVGDEKGWKSRTGAVISALEDMVAKKPGAQERVHSTTECAGCHNAHRKGGNK